MNRPVAPRFQIERWPTERPLFVLVAAAAIVLWTLLALSVIGVLYAALLGLFFFGAHLVSIARVRGSAVRLGSDQFPELYAAVARLAADMGMALPDVYVTQAGGVLNALATRFFGGELVVLNAELLEACGDDHAARDMVIAHELAHLKCGHLRVQWLLLPGFFVPFLGTALARAREYTCDRFGLAGAGSREGALLGLTILAAGPRFGRGVNLDAFQRQRADVNTGLMTLGEWMSSHPPLAKRVAALDPALTLPGYSPALGRMRAAATLAAALVPVVAAGVLGAAYLPSALKRVNGRMAADLSAAPARGARAVADADADAPYDSPDDSVAGALSDEEVATRAARARADLAKLALFIDQTWAQGALPDSIEEIEDRWQELRPGAAFPVDPFDGYDYGYELDDDGGYLLWSPGPDRQDDTDDDIERTGPAASHPRI